MDLVKQLRESLNLVDHDHAIVRPQLFHDPSRILAQVQICCRVEQIVDTDVRKGLTDEKGLARLPGSQQEIGLLLDQCRKIENPLHGGRVVGHKGLTTQSSFIMTYDD